MRIPHNRYRGPVCCPIDWRQRDSMAPMKPRFLFFVFALTLVVGSTVWRVLNPRERVAVSLESLNVRAAPEFQLLDQNNRPIQLKGYLGRYRILLYFFDSIEGPDADVVLQRLREVYPVLKKSRIMVFAISTPLRPDHKLLALSYPFPILRDTLAGQRGSCTAIWGRTKVVDSTGTPARIDPAAFVIEANGLVNWDKDTPRPVEDPLALINAFVTGEL